VGSASLQEVQQLALQLYAMRVCPPHRLVIEASGWESTIPGAAEAMATVFGPSYRLSGENSYSPDGHAAAVARDAATALGAVFVYQGPAVQAHPGRVY
jgi:hypothetical protein